MAYERTNIQAVVGDVKTRDSGHVLYTSVTLVGFQKTRFHMDSYFKPIQTGMEWLAGTLKREITKVIGHLPGGTQSDIYVTSWALQGLSPDRKYDEIDDDLDKQLVWIKQFQNKDGGFPRFKDRPSDPEVTAAAIMAFAAYNDPLNTRRIAISYLTRAQEADGGFISGVPIELESPAPNLQTTCFVLIAIHAEAGSE